MDNKNRALLLMSGGLDSTYCALHLINENYEVSGLFFDYGQRAAYSECKAVEKISAKLGLDFDVINAADLFGDILKYSKMSNVPRNAIFVAASCSIASKLNAGCIVLGAGPSDSNRFDCGREFANHLDMALKIGHPNLSLKLPLWDGNIERAQIREFYLNGIGQDILDMTHSCYSADKCGVCFGCVLKNEATQ